MRRCDVNIVVIVNRGGMHEARHLALVLVHFFFIIVHGRLVHIPLGSSFSVQVVAKKVDAFAAENTKDFALLAREFSRRLAAKYSKLIP